MYNDLYFEIIFYLCMIDEKYVIYELMNKFNCLYE